MEILGPSTLSITILGITILRITILSITILSITILSITILSMPMNKMGHLAKCQSVVMLKEYYAVSFMLSVANKSFK